MSQYIVPEIITIHLVLNRNVINTKSQLLLEYKRQTINFKVKITIIKKLRGISSTNLNIKQGTDNSDP